MSKILKQGEVLQAKAAHSRLKAALAQLINSTDHLEYLREGSPEHVKDVEDLINRVKTRMDQLERAWKAA